MSNYKRPENQAEFEANFAAKKPLMKGTEAHYASSKCLFCYDAPCVKACPTAIDIPLFIKQINSGNLKGAAKTIYESNWMGNACGTICPTGVLCEGACVYNHQDIIPVEIGRLQNYATAQAIAEDWKLFGPGPDKGQKVAIIGGGPAGLACACELRLLGYEVDVYEAKDKLSGLTVFGVAPYKISNEEVLAEVEYLQKRMGFKVFYNNPIESREQLDRLETAYAAVFLGVGLGPTAWRNIPGEDKAGVVGAVEFIEELRMQQHRAWVGDKVVVLGGGNTAMDAASEAARMGASEVYLVYRGTKDKMGAYDFEYALTQSAGVRSIFEASPVEILGGDKVEGIRLSNGQSLACDQVIKATGQAKMGGFFALIPELQTDGSGRLLVNPETGQTHHPRYFAGGDAVNGGAEVVNAAYEGKVAAHGIHQFIAEKA